MFEELDSLLESPTIRPTFEKVHVILALFIFAENREGIGRYRLQKELLIGEGTAKSLIKKLNKDISFITVTKETKRKGHFLTQEGINYLQRVKKIIPIIKECETSLLKEIIIDAERADSYICLVKSAINKITNGIIHHSFLCQKKASSSPNIPNLDIKIFIGLIFNLFFYRIVAIYFLIIKFSKTSISIPLLLKVLKAFAGEVTIGSPLRLKEVFRSTGTPVASPNFFTIR